METRRTNGALSTQSGVEKDKSLSKPPVDCNLCGFSATHNMSPPSGHSTQSAHIPRPQGLVQDQTEVDDIRPRKRKFLFLGGGGMNLELLGLSSMTPRQEKPCREAEKKPSPGDAVIKPHLKTNLSVL